MITPDYTRLYNADDDPDPPSRREHPRRDDPKLQAELRDTARLIQRALRLPLKSAGRLTVATLVARVERGDQDAVEELREFVADRV